LHVAALAFGILRASRLRSRFDTRYLNYSCNLIRARFAPSSKHATAGHVDALQSKLNWQRGETVPQWRPGAMRSLQFLGMS
jgi:hypothetical protein